jgi:hypothetical protein
MGPSRAGADRLCRHLVSEIAFCVAVLFFVAAFACVAALVVTANVSAFNAAINAAGLIVRAGVI